MAHGGGTPDGCDLALKGNGSTTMMYRILGQPVIGEDDGPPVPLPGGHRLIVLAVLLVNANRRVSSEDLLRAAWGHTDVESTQLHKCISDLRALLGRVGRREDLKTISRYGYELQVDEADLDKLVFERLIREAETAGAERRPEREVHLLRSAL